VAKIWIVSGSLDPADVIVILGGGLDVRPAAAAELYKRGISRWILVATAETDHGRDANLNREMLIQHGVPPAAIREFSYRLLSTYGEVQPFRDSAKTVEQGV
jgi:hypothetical protein